MIKAMVFNTWFTMTKADGSEHKSAERMVPSQEEFTQFVQLMAGYVFGEAVVVELAADPNNPTALYEPKEMAGSCLVKLKISTPALEDNMFHYFNIKDLRFHWEPHRGTVSAANEWERLSSQTEQTT